MNIPPLTQQERAVLLNLAERGASRAISPPMSGRLALYELIAETPAGWTITPAGQEALRRPVSSPPNGTHHGEPKPQAERSARRGARKTRVSPFF